MISKRVFMTAATALLLSAVSLVGVVQPAMANNERKPIRLYDGGWENIQVNNAIAKYLIESVFSLQVETVPSNVPDMQKQMKAGTIDINMEMWRSLMNPWVTGALNDGAIVDLGVTYESASQGFYVPTYVISGDDERGISPVAPQLKTVEDLVDLAAVFAGEKDSAGYINCIPGWACRETNLVRMAAYGVSDQFESIELSSEAELNEMIHSQYKQGMPFVTYYWDPSPLLGQLDMTLLEEPDYNDGCWVKVEQAITDYKPGNTSEEACAYKTVPISKFATTSFRQQHPEVAELLQRMMVGTDMVRTLVGHMTKNEVSADVTALHFLETYPDVWKSWLTPDQVARVTASLTN